MMVVQRPPLTLVIDLVVGISLLRQEGGMP